MGGPNLCMRCISPRALLGATLYEVDTYAYSVFVGADGIIFLTLFDP
jgi:hypothetical protein